MIINAKSATVVYQDCARWASHSCSFYLLGKALEGTCDVQFEAYILFQRMARWISGLWTV